MLSVAVTRIPSAQVRVAGMKASLRPDNREAKITEPDKHGFCARWKGSRKCDQCGYSSFTNR